MGICNIVLEEMDKINWMDLNKWDLRSKIASIFEAYDYIARPDRIEKIIDLLNS